MPKYLNSFTSPVYVEQTVVDKNGVVGVIRIKPSGVSWKPRGGQRFFSVPLARFAEWITDPATKAFRAKR
jgi:hypothetical protein